MKITVQNQKGLSVRTFNLKVEGRGGLFEKRYSLQQRQ